MCNLVRATSKSRVQLRFLKTQLSITCTGVRFMHIRSYAPFRLMHTQERPLSIHLGDPHDASSAQGQAPCIR
jgi:hypothetical protein